MPESQDAKHDEQQKRQQMAPQEESLAHEADSSTFDSLPGSTLSSDKLNGRGNAPVRVAAMQRMQQTYGNRAVQRYVQHRAGEPKSAA